MPFDPQLFPRRPTVDEEHDLRLPDELASLGEQLSDDAEFITNRYPASAPPREAVTEIANVSGRASHWKVWIPAAAAAVLLIVVSAAWQMRRPVVDATGVSSLDQTRVATTSSSDYKSPDDDLTSTIAAARSTTAAPPARLINTPVDATTPVDLAHQAPFPVRREHEVRNLSVGVLDEQPAELEDQGILLLQRALERYADFIDQELRRREVERSANAELIQSLRDRIAELEAQLEQALQGPVE